MDPNGVTDDNNNNNNDAPFVAENNNNDDNNNENNIYSEDVVDDDDDDDDERKPQSSSDPQSHRQVEEEEDEEQHHPAAAACTVAAAAEGVIREDGGFNTARADEEEEEEDSSSLPFREAKQGLMMSFYNQEKFRGEKRTIVGMLLADQQAATAEQKRQERSNTTSPSRQLSQSLPHSSSRSLPASNTNNTTNNDRTDSSPPPLRSTRSLRSVRTSSSSSSTILYSRTRNMIPDRIDLVGNQIRRLEGGRPNPNHAPGAYRMNTPATTRLQSSIRRMRMNYSSASSSASSLHSGDGMPAARRSRRYTPSTTPGLDPLQQQQQQQQQQVVNHNNPSTDADNNVEEAIISATVVRADSLPQLQQQQQQQQSETEGGDGWDMEQPAPVAADGYRKRRRPVLLFAVSSVSILLIGFGILGLIMGLGNGSNSNNDKGEEPQDTRTRCGLHPQSLLVNCDIYNGGARALIPECAEAAYESLPPPPNSNQTFSASCSASELARVSLALHLANYNERLTNPTSAMFLILATLYYSTNGPKWTKDDSWFVRGMSPCSWFGITCDPLESYVEKINLNRNRLGGSLPTELGLLTKLST